jgi:predicted HicB family RNase H-like nuclease
MTQQNKLIERLLSKPKDFSWDELAKLLKSGEINMKDAMKYKGYYGSVHFDDEELIFHGKIEFIRALVTYEATDAKGLRKAFEDAVDDYLETCKGNKIEPETPFKGSLNVRLGEELHRRIAVAAHQNDSTINKFIVQTLDQAVK